MNRRRRIYFTVQERGGQTWHAAAPRRLPPSLLSLQPFSAFCGAIANAVNLRVHTHTLSQSQTTAGMLQNMGYGFRELVSVGSARSFRMYTPAWLVTFISGLLLEYSAHVVSFDWTRARAIYDL